MVETCGQRPEGDLQKQMQGRPNVRFQHLDNTIPSKHIVISTTFKRSVQYVNIRYHPLAAVPTSMATQRKARNALHFKKRAVATLFPH